MFGIVLAALGFLILYAVTSPDRGNWRVIGTIQVAYGLRLVLQSFLRDVDFFHDKGVDNETYEFFGQLFAAIWEHSGYHYVTAAEYPGLASDPFPANMFGTVMYLNGGPTRIGCTAVVALCACLACYNLYRLAIELGGEPKLAFAILVLTLFGPAILMYTSDTYKDGFVALFATGVVASAFRLARRFSWLHLTIGLVCLVCVWQVRFYLVFLTVPPFIVGLFGIDSRASWRPLVVCAALAAVGIFVAGYTHVFSTASDVAFNTVDFSTGTAAHQANAAGGSGVEFDDGGKMFGAFGPKLAYTLFSPFPWQSGSLGFHIGKIDAFIFYFLIYRAFKASISLVRGRLVLLLMFLVFLVPTTVAYATTMANVGLIVRQRIPIVLICGLLASLSTRAERVVDEEAREDAEADGSEGAALAPGQ